MRGKNESAPPLILYAPARGRLIVSACSPQATRLGVKPGMPLAEAKAVMGTPTTAHFEPHEETADRATLRKLALWCQRYSPLVAIEPPDSLFLDITGCGPVFGGERKLAERTVAQLHGIGYVAKVVIADTARAAWGISRYAPPLTPDPSPLSTRERGGYHTQIVAPKGQRRVLAPLPVEALGISEEVVQLLRDLDIRRIEQLLQLPRALLPTRFGPELLRRLDQAIGDIKESFSHELALEPIEASWNFDYPSTNRRAVEAVLERLLEEVLAKLKPQQMGIERLLCKLHLAGREPYCLLVGLLHASDSMRYLMDLVRLHLERVRLTAEVTAITVHAALAIPLEFHQERMFGQDSRAERWRNFPTLVEVLSSRLGKKAVLRAQLQPDPQPEYAWNYEPWLEQEISRAPADLLARRASERNGAFFRPLSLQAEPVAVAVVSVVPGGPPLRFTWRNRTFALARIWGPERIETGWWRENDVRRDYYLVEATTGERFWLFRTLECERWFLHGECG